MNANNDMFSSDLVGRMPQTSCLLVNFHFHFTFLCSMPLVRHVRITFKCIAHMCVHLHVFARSDDPDFSGIHHLGYLCIQKVTSYLKCKWASPNNHLVHAAHVCPAVMAVVVKSFTRSSQKLETNLCMFKTVSMPTHTHTMRKRWRRKCESV